MKNKLQNFLYVFLIAAGLLQVIGYLLGSPAIRGLGSAFASSPLPIVFTEVKGIETFASEFRLEYITESGDTVSMNITPEIYSRFQGPYNRRNIYGAAFAYGPILPEDLRNAVLKNGFCGKQFLKEDLGIQSAIRTATIHISTKTSNRKDTWDISVDCRE